MYRIGLLAWRYIFFHKTKTLILVACLTLTIYMPAAIHLVVNRFERELHTRAASTPLVLGARGSRFDLALHALHFQAQPPAAITMGDVQQVQQSGLALAIPLHARHTARRFPIVGTSLEYFDFRQLELTEGTRFVRLGDCVIGSAVARQLGLSAGDHLLSDPENAFDIAGSYPLKMHIRGVLAPTHTDDDRAVFVDVRTAWILEGLGHGHQDLTNVTDENLILKRDQEKVVAGAAVLEYTEITDQNIDSFHFHGDEQDFPITAMIAIPHDPASQAKLKGRYLSDKATVQVLEPVNVIEQLIARVFKVKRFFDLGILVVIFVTALLVGLVMLLSLRLRKREMETMYKLGCSRFTMFSLQATELVIVGTLSLAVSGGLGVATFSLASQMIRQLIFS